MNIPLGDRTPSCSTAAGEMWLTVRPTRERTTVSAELTYESTSKFVKLPSGGVHYNVAGRGHPVILLHGSGPGATGWGNFGTNIGHLAERFTCYAGDMPGWGASDTVRPSHRDRVQTTLELTAQRCLETSAFVGKFIAR